MARRVRENDFSTRQSVQGVQGGLLKDHHALEVGKLVRFPEKMPGVGAVVTHQAEQRGAVAYPVILAQAGGGVLVEPQVPLDVLAHRAVDVGEDVRGRVVEGVVEIEQPDASRLHLVRLDHRADAVVGQNLQQQRVFDAAVDDVHALDSVAGGIERRADLGQHAAGQSAVFDHFVDLLGRDAGDQLAVLVEHARGVGEQGQLLGLEDFGDLAGDDVGVDVVGLAILADADWGNDRDEGALVEMVDQGRIDLGDLADLADVNQVARIVFVFEHQLLGANEIAVLAGQTDCFAAVLVDQIDDVLVDLAAEDHFDDFHGFGVGDAHALDELALLADAGQQVFDLRAAAMDDDDVEADQFEEHDVASKTVLQMFVGHRVAAIFDDDGLAVETLDVGQGFGQNGG